MPDDPRRIVESGYDAIADRYADAIRAGRGPETYFRRFLDSRARARPRWGTVLDLGCGAGLIAAELSTRASRGGGHLGGPARARAPECAGARLVRADMMDVAFATRGRSTRSWRSGRSSTCRGTSTRRCSRGSMRGSKPGGLFAGTLGAATTPRTSFPDFYGAPMYWSHFDAETNRTLLREAGFDVLRGRRGRGRGRDPPVGDRDERDRRSRGRRPFLRATHPDRR